MYSTVRTCTSNKNDFSKDIDYQNSTGDEWSHNGPFIDVNGAEIGSMESEEVCHESLGKNASFFSRNNANSDNDRN